MKNQISLEDRVFIVTAGAGGIGTTTAELAASRGAKIVVADLFLEAAETLAHKISANGGDAIALHVDLGDEDKIKALVNAVVNHYGRIDVLNNNAALINAELAELDKNVEAMPTDLWDQTFQVNVRGTMVMSRECLPHLIETKGNIVNTASNLGLQGHVVQVA